MDAIYISRNREELRIEEIVNILQKTEWASNRTIDYIEKSIDNSLCYGVFNDKDKMIGFARIITDQVTTFYLMDVIIEEAYRGQGLGKKLMDAIMEDVGDLYGILHTDGARGFYEPYGFQVTATSDSGEYTMEKPKGGREYD